jgi:hypothetical protein
MISEYLPKVKRWFDQNQSDLFIAATVFLVSMASFGLGRLSVIVPPKEPLKIMENQELGIKNQGRNFTTDGQIKAPSLDSKFLLRESAPPGRYVASKNGSAYHYPWCPGALKIKEANKLWFRTREEAEAKGYKPAGNCPGLER